MNSARLHGRAATVLAAWFTLASTGGATAAPAQGAQAPATPVQAPSAAPPPVSTAPARGAAGPDSDAPAQDARKLSLTEAMQIAIERNPGMTSAELDVLLARLAEERTRLDRFTASVDLIAGDTGSVTFGSTRANLTGVDLEDRTYRPLFGNSASYGAQASLSVPVYTGGLVTANIRRSTVDVRIAEVDRALFRRDLVRAVYQSYWNIVGFDLQLAAAEEALGQSREALSIIEAKQKTGLAAPLELNRFRVDVLSQEQRLSELELQAYRSRQDLLRLLHLEGENVVLTDAARDVAISDWAPSSASLLDKARQSRIELLSLNLAIEGAQYDRQAAASAYKPTVSLDFTAQAGGQADWVFQREGVITSEDGSGVDLDTFGDAILEPGVNLTAGVNLRWNLFNLWRTAYNVRRVDVAVKQIEAQRQSQVDTIHQEVKSAHQQVLNLKRRQATVDKQLELATDNQNIIQTLYGQGSATILDLFEAQSAYRTALSQEATQRVNLVLAEFELRWTLGEDFVPSAAGER